MRPDTDDEKAPPKLPWQAPRLRAMPAQESEGTPGNSNDSNITTS
jgi:hypothetical protein